MSCSLVIATGLGARQWRGKVDCGTMLVGSYFLQEQHGVAMAVDPRPQASEHPRGRPVNEVIVRTSARSRRGSGTTRIHAAGSQRQRQIVEIVLQLVAERGADAVSIQAIADRIGVTQPAIFRHFPNKQSIWVAVMDWLAENLRAIHSNAQVESNESALVALEHMFLDHIRMIRRYPALAKVVFSDHLRLQFPVLQNRFARIHDAYQDRVIHLIEHAKKQKLVSMSLPAAQAATLFFCMVQGLGFQFAIARRPMRLLSEAERVFALYLRALSVQK
jgi:TetR/AcrR family transcriptional regulator